MIIDVLFLILLVMAFVKGYKNGFIVAVFSVIALLAGLAAAIKLSTVVAAYLKDSVNISVKWLPAISFVLVFLGVILLVRLIARVLEKTVEMVMLGWLNKLGGILLYTLLFIVIFSVFLFYSEKIHLLTGESIASSYSYRFVQPWGPGAMDSLGVVLPFFKNMFHELEMFFGKAAGRAS